MRKCSIINDFPFINGIESPKSLLISISIESDAQIKIHLKRSQPANLPRQMKFNSSALRNPMAAEQYQKALLDGFTASRVVQ